MISVTASEAAALIHDGRPLAVLDLREAGQFGEGHPLFAMPLPYSQLERRVSDLVPRLSERLLLMDQGDGVAERAARRLADAGYDCIHVLAGGVPAWQAAGFGIYKGVNVPSKLMGELAETIWHPEMLTADRLAEWQAAGQPHRLFDARPAAEYARMRVPGAVCLPNGELPHHAARLPDDAPVVITCAGRTRGIIGAVGLRLAGHAGPVLALENGTQGWALSGRQLERGNTATPLPALTDSARTASARAADALIARFGLPKIDAETAAGMLRDPEVTSYLMDVRSAAEVAASPVQGAIHAPGGQLVQATDQWLAVRHARVILCCDTGLRAALAAFWLRQLGYAPFILPLSEASRLSLAPARPAIPAPKISSLTATAALAARAAGARLVDLRPALAYRAGHVAGADWGIRPRLAELVGKDRARPCLLVTDSREEAAFAARDLSEAGVRTIHWVEGGHAALQRAGAPIEATSRHPKDADCIDHLFFVHDRHDGNLDAARRYLAWETGLIAQLSPQEAAEFRMIRP